VSFRLKILHVFVLLGILVTALPNAAKADALVTFAGTTYDISTITGTYAANASVIDATPWFGNFTLASNLSEALGGALGYQTLSGTSQQWGPFFAFFNDTALHSVDSYTYTGGPSPGELFPDNGNVFVYTWAVGSVVSTTPEPGTLSMALAGLFGLGLLVAVKRYRENRPATTA